MISPVWVKPLFGVGASLVSTAVIGLLKWMTAMFRKLSDTNKTITLLTTNHLPHIQAALETHTETLSAMRSDIRDIDTKMTVYGQRLDGTNTAVEAINEAFVRHLEHAPDTKRRKR